MAIGAWVKARKRGGTSQTVANGGNKKRHTPRLTVAVGAFGVTFGVLARDALGETSLIASDLTRFLPAAFQALAADVTAKRERPGARGT